MPAHTRFNALVSSIAAAVLSVFAKQRPKPSVKDIDRMEFKTSTQRMGVRFTERIRDVFRFKWLKKH